MASPAETNSPASARLLAIKLNFILKPLSECYVALKLRVLAEKCFKKCELNKMSMNKYNEAIAFSK